jgi:hypothetical protein
MARRRGINTEAMARIRRALSDAKDSFALSSDEAKEALFYAEERFDPWVAATQGADNEDPSQLGERTNGQDSTRLLSAQYFFNKETLIGDIYLKFRGQKNRRNGPYYVFNNVPAFVAKRYMTALSKGKTFNTMGLSGGYTRDTTKFSLEPATPFGAKIQKGNYGNVPPIPGVPRTQPLSEGAYESGLGIQQQSDNT